MEACIKRLVLSSPIWLVSAKRRNMRVQLSNREVARAEGHLTLGVLFIAFGCETSGLNWFLCWSARAIQLGKV